MKPSISHAVLLAGALGLATTGFAQGTQTEKDKPQQPAAQQPAPMAQQPATTGEKPVIPSKSETADSAFKKLDAGAKGHVAKNDTDRLSGFEVAFEQADTNKDGRLTQAEFARAWTVYTGNK